MEPNLRGLHSRFTLLSVIILFFSSTPSSAGKGTDTILVFHPTVSNIETLNYLLSEHILPLEGWHFIGVYHVDEKYDYGRSGQYLAEHPGIPFSLRAIEGAFDASGIYGTHGSSAVFRALFSSSAGAIFLGGPDLPPSAYSEPMHLLTDVTDPWRHYLELSILFHLLGGSQDQAFKPYMEERPGYSVLGICLGMQTLNVATGGTLVQDIPSEIYGSDYREEIMNGDPAHIHRNYVFDMPGDSIYLTSYHAHHIHILPAGASCKALVSLKHNGAFVMSSHHQAIGQTGKGLRAAAVSADGKIIEAVVHEQYPSVLGVQFHPEKSFIYENETELFVSPDSLVNIHEYLLETGSLDFHMDFWKKIAGNFNMRNSGKSRK